MPRLAVLGHPVAHSRSPAMHMAALEEMGLSGAWTYESIDVAPSDFESRVRSLPGQDFAGVNVTLPHKVAALALADDASDAAREIGAANTLTFADGLISAENTDARAIAEALPMAVGGVRALVLGAGGSARAAIWALAQAGAVVNVWNRTSEKARALAAGMGVGLDTRDPAIIVNATTVGLEAANEVQPLGECGPPDLKPFPLFDDGLQAQVVMDLVYGSRETNLIKAARAAGALTIDGLEILARQGAASLRLWTGMEPPLETMRAAVKNPT
jgi:shikimate dehydrogenase